MKSRVCRNLRLPKWIYLSGIIAIGASPALGQENLTKTEINTKIEANRNEENPSTAEDYCSTFWDFDFLFFANSAFLKDWRDARNQFYLACKAWEEKKQDVASLKNITEKRDAFVNLSLAVPNLMVAETIKIMGPARDQGTASNCFANVVADLIGVRVGQRVSAFSVQVRTAIEAEKEGKFDILKRWALSKSRFNGEYLDNAMEGGTHGPVCKEDQPNGALKYSKADLLTFWNNYEHGLRTYFGPKPPLQYITPIVNSLNKLAPSLNSQDFIKNSNKSQRGDIALGTWLDRQCGIKLKAQISGRNASPIFTINDGLRKNVPVGIGHKADLLIEGQSGGHASVIVGKMVFKERTSYLLRNSWGPKCSYYSSPFCKSGHIWISEEDLKKALFAAYYYQ